MIQRSAEDLTGLVSGYSVGSPEEPVRTQTLARGDKSVDEEPVTLDHAEFVLRYGQPTFRNMKAIGTQSVCTICHDTGIAPEVSTLTTFDGVFLT